MTGSERMVRVLELAKKHGVAVIQDNCELHPTEVMQELTDRGVDLGDVSIHYESGHGLILHADDGMAHKTFNTSLSIGKDCTSRGIPWVDFDGRLATSADPRCPVCFVVSDTIAKGEG